MADDLTSENPFVRYRERLDAYLVARRHGFSDADYVALVNRLDDAVAAVDGHGFVRTPLVAGTAVMEAAGVDAKLVLKDETDGVAGSHKARHLFGLALHLAVSAPGSARGRRPWAIASCGNAALAAGVVAAAAGHELAVFVPDWADRAIVDRLTALGASVRTCDRRAGEVGDPAFARYREAVDDGAVPFTVQGTEAPAVIDGGRTIGWELAEMLATAEGATSRIDDLYVQVGGGALAVAVSMAMFDAVDCGWLAAPPRIRAVQPLTAHPLVRAWDRLVGRDADGEPRPGVDPVAAVAEARAHPDRYMTPWEAPPRSVATGILDDLTHDWIGVIEAMARTGGTPVLADEADLVRARDLVAAHAGIEASATGTAGVAGILADPPSPGARVAALVTGRA